MRIGRKKQKGGGEPPQVVVPHLTQTTPPPYSEHQHPPHPQQGPWGLAHIPPLAYVPVSPLLS